MYLRPTRTTPHDPDAAWYENVPVGKNSLSTMVKDMCGEANNRCNNLVSENVPEWIVQKVTGHRSLETLRSYERISVSQNQVVSKILMTNMQSESVAVKCDSQQMFRSLSGINHFSIGNITFNIGNQQAASE